jgi:hypothetical protein
MRLIIFLQIKNGKFKRIEIEVLKFKKSAIIMPKGRMLIRMTLQDASKHNFYNLLTADVLHVYVKEDDYSKAYIMPKVKAFSLKDLDLSLEHQDFVRRIEERNKKELAAIDENISYIINNFSDVRSEKFHILSEALFLSVTGPEFLRELKNQLNFTKKKAKSMN